MRFNATPMYDEGGSSWVNSQLLVQLSSWRGHSILASLTWETLEREKKWIERIKRREMRGFGSGFMMRIPNVCVCTIV